MALGLVTWGAKGTELGHLHQHDQSSDLAVHDSGIHEHQASNEGTHCLVGRQNCLAYSNTQKLFSCFVTILCKHYTRAAS